MIEALEDDLAEPGEYLEAIRTQTEILSALVDDLFELARIDAGVLTLELCDASLGELVSRCVRSVDAEARACEVELEARIGEDPIVRIAPDKVERVLLNLLTNAVRHSPPRGEVAVVVEPNHDHVVVAVEDSGDGLAPDASQRMFDRFWRADESRSRAASSRRTAERSGLRTETAVARASRSRCRSPRPAAAARLETPRACTGRRDASDLTVLER